MNKRELLNIIIANVLERFNLLTASAQEARDAATNEESKAENKYDTRGLEASYLAGAQSKRSQEIKESLFYLQKIEDKDLAVKDKIGLLSIVSLVDESDIETMFFILPVQGGIKLKDQIYGSISTITLNTPLGRAMINKKVGEEVELKKGNSSRYYEVKNIF